MAEYEDERRELLSQIEKGRSEAARLADGLLAALSDWMAEYVRDLVQRVVTTQPERTQAIGQVQLADMKNHLRAFVAKLPETLRSATDKVPALWPWRPPATTPQEFEDATRTYAVEDGYYIPAGLSEPLRSVVAALYEAVVAPYGYQRPPGRATLDARSMPVGAGEAMVRYREVGQGLLRLEDSLRSLVLKHAQAEAGKLWDQA